MIVSQPLYGLLLHYTASTPVIPNLITQASPCMLSICLIKAFNSGVDHCVPWSQNVSLFPEMYYFALNKLHPSPH